MSANLYRYTEECEGVPCPGDCDMCNRNIQSNLFDIEEIYENCTVQILKNSITGEISIGWWENELQDDGQA